jgi:hypothetical protein
MKVLTEHNARSLLIDLGVELKRAGRGGMPLAGMGPADAYLAGVHTMSGNAALVTRGGEQFVVWLEEPADNPPVFITER